MLSTLFLNKQIEPMIFEILQVHPGDPIIHTVKMSATKGIDYLLVLSEKVPLGVIRQSSLLKELDRLSDISLKDFIEYDFCVIEKTQLDQTDYLNIKNRYIIIKNNNNYENIMDLQFISTRYNHLLDNTMRIFDSILDSCYNGIIAIDEEKNIIVLNKNAADIYGVEARDVIDKPLSEVLPESPLNHVMFESAPSVHNKCQVNGKIIQANRTLITVHGTTVGGISIFQDITNSEEAQKELALVKSNEEYLESIIENSYDGIYITNKDGMTLHVNKSYGQITGIKKEQLIGKYMKDLVKEGLLSTYITDTVVALKKPVTNTQTIQNGKKVVITGSPIFDESGNVSKVITNVRDVTELLNLEKQLLISNERSSLYQKQLFKDIASEKIICRSKIFTETLDLAKRVSTKDSTVLIFGETGVGKEIVAKYIHMSSNRKNNHYIKINCGAIPASLLESELFGYAPGAFTGANSKGKVGMFELANEGTLFLDEIGELALDLQSSLLRILQDGEVFRLGDTKSRKTNVRIIAATNRNLEEMIANGSFRNDLFYRLNVVSIRVPPLRERLSDIPGLAEHFINELNDKYNEKKMITSNFINQLMKQNWPGNIREMSNFIEKQFVLADGDILDSFALNSSFEMSGEENSLRITIKGIIPLNEAVKEVESILIGRAIRKGRTTYRAAELLNMSQPTFYRKYKELYKDDLGDDNNYE